MPMRERPDLLSEDSPGGLEVFQLTTEETPSSHIYMEAQIFAPDSRRFILHHPARAHGIDFMDPAHRYLVCDLDAGGELTPIIEEVGAMAPSVSPDGEFLYYFVDGTTPAAGGRLTLKRVRMDGGGREEITALDGIPARVAGTVLSGLTRSRRSPRTETGWRSRASSATAPRRTRPGGCWSSTSPPAAWS